MQRLRKLRTDMVILPVLLAAGLWGSTGFSREGDAGTPDAGYEVLGEDLEPFRSAFNAASDRPRAVLLVGPT